MIKKIKRINFKIINVVIKIYYTLFIIYIIYKKDYFYLNIKNKNKILEDEKKKYFSFFFLKSKPLNINNDIVVREKKNILKKISKELRKNISFINKIFITDNHNFGNSMALLNKFIFYCELIGCKTIILDNKFYWFIKNKINLITNNITIEVDDKSRYINNSSILFYNAKTFYHSFFNIKPEIRIHLLRNEILKNLPIINSSNKDLYIHVRSGDIFKIKNYGYSYSQPPLCFYKNILKNFNFINIVLISSDNLNPIIKKLINQYPKIINKKNSIKMDISLLINIRKINNYFFIK